MKFGDAYGTGLVRLPCRCKARMVLVPAIDFTIERIEIEMGKKFHIPNECKTFKNIFGDVHVFKPCTWEKRQAEYCPKHQRWLK